MAFAGVDPGALKAILVSHCHKDHITGVGVLSRKYKLPVFLNHAAWRRAGKALGKLHSLELFQTGRIFQLAGFRIHPFSLPHDCADPVGFRISRGSARLGIATDLGTPTGLVMQHLAGVQALIIESNHDPAMLMEGPYPWELKQRVKSRLGHLSNGAAADLLSRITSDELQAVVLAHLSETNNSPDLALECARSGLREFLAHGGALFCASQARVGPEIDL
jgi:phosphoribosyl 1,2-cyclic phosphodiesterase